MLMLASDIAISGGINNVANLVIELAEEHDGFDKDLVATAPLFPDAAARRIGWMLDTFGGGAPIALQEYCSFLESDVSVLSPTNAKVGKTVHEWKIIVNEEVDPDV